MEAGQTKPGVGGAAPYHIMWDYIIPEQLVALPGLGLLIPGLLKRKRKSADKSAISGESNELAPLGI